MEILIITLTVTVCAFMVGSAIGVRVYNEYEYRSRQEPVGYDPNPF